MSKVRVLGMMSGTSMDGVDAAVIETDGEDRIEFGPAASFPYPSDVQEALLGARGWDVSPEIHQLVEVLHSPNFVTLKTGPLRNGASPWFGISARRMSPQAGRVPRLRRCFTFMLCGRWG